MMITIQDLQELYEKQYNKRNEIQERLRKAACELICNYRQSLDVNEEYISVGYLTYTSFIKTSVENIEMNEHNALCFILSTLLDPLNPEDSNISIQIALREIKGGDIEVIINGDQETVVLADEGSNRYSITVNAIKTAVMNEITR
ncbi:hypothetical protein GJV07_23270 [Enterobacteriaceae bacterium RIT711]|nr:hypothetical protein [Enterobacteriaceae bacterium RIT711]